MEKKLKIQFWKPEKALAMQILEQEGLPLRPLKPNGPFSIEEDGYFVKVHDDTRNIWLEPTYIVLQCKCLEGEDKKHCWDYYKIATITFDSNEARDNYLAKVVNKITDEIFNAPRIEPKVEKNGEVETYIWDIANLIKESN